MVLVAEQHSTGNKTICVPHSVSCKPVWRSVTVECNSSVLYFDFFVDYLNDIFNIETII
jgi:hypothetical protein